MEKFYGTVLDIDRSVDDDQWTIRTKDETLEAARAREEFSGVMCTIPRNGYWSKCKEKTTLSDLETGEPYSAAIYLFTKIEAHPSPAS